MKTFESELTELINRYSIENGSDTPDWILAEYIKGALKSYEKTVRMRDHWYSFTPWSEGITIKPDMCSPPEKDE